MTSQLTYDAVTENTTPTETITSVQADAQPVAQSRVRISIEAIIYALLLLLSLALRMAELGAVPLNDREAHEALAVFRAIDPRAVGSDLVAHNPLMFTINVLTMSIAGSDTATVRVSTVLLSVLLVGMPFLFRRWLGRANMLIIAGLLTISPVLLVASRLMSGSVWSAALALGAIYLAGKFIESRRAPYAIAASTAALMGTLAAESAGLLTFVGVAVGVVYALLTIDDPDRRYRHAIGEILRDWPWFRSILVGGIAVVLVAMAFLLYPAGLSGIGDVLLRTISGFGVRPFGYPFAYPLLTSFLYEPLLWVFGLAGAYLVLKSTDNSELMFLRRAMVGWLLASVVWSVLYASAEPGYALWLTLPLAGLSAYAIERAMTPVQDRFWDVPSWGPWLHGLAVAATLSIAAINLLYVARAIQDASPDALPTLQQPMKLLMVLPALLLAFITFFLVGSMWGARASWRGTGIGLLLFLGVYGLGSGWRAAVANADDPRELWHLRPATRNLNLMMDTLLQASDRATGMRYDMEIIVVPPQDTPFDDGALAWLLRNYYRTQFVRELPATASAHVIITPYGQRELKLGQEYVGQDFPLYYTWNRGSLGWDFLTWIYDRDSRIPPDTSERIIAWVRADVYGVLPDARPADAR
jgi:hypothetical protein